MLLDLSKVLISWRVSVEVRLSSCLEGGEAFGSVWADDMAGCGRGFESHTDEREEMREELEEEGLSGKKIQKLLDEKYPPYPVNHYQVNSVTASNTRVIQIEASGDIETTVLMDKVPESQADADEIAARVRQNPPFIYGRLVSLDEQGALIMAGFVADRFTSGKVFQAVYNNTVLPVVDFTPAPAISNFTFHRGDRFPNWQDDLLVGTLKAATLYRLRIKDGQLKEQEKLIADFGRIRDVAMGDDGLVYIVIEHNENGSLWRLVPE